MVTMGHRNGENLSFLSYQKYAPPVGDLSIAEAWEAWGPEAIIWVSFPETSSCRGAEEARRYTTHLLNAESGRVPSAGFRAIVETIESCGNCQYTIG